MADGLPEFSVSERAGDMVVELGTGPPARLPGGVVGLSVAAGALWCGVVGAGGFLAFSTVEFAGWHVVVGVALLIAAAVCSANVAGWVERRFGQYDAAIRVAGVSAWAGVGVGATAACAGLVAAYGVGAGWVLLPGVFGGMCLLRAPFAAVGARRGLAYVRGRQAAIRHLRRYGRRMRGVLVSVEFERTWHQGAPEFRVEIACGLGVVGANMVTRADRVPVVGSGVVVTCEVARGDVLVDLAAGAAFEADANRWREPAE
ncbi:hypothetical protein [Phytomonospora endophytica]|uniref:Uncharacterized protein n=1 Tax=Phytomonospora endophytica TaxID=714109 RepID=A0A841FJX5_9ACTN|nr:hypothetical protein [Phytomonospora endophytica]MBB6036145.1 hypothetical protein [Phytomonospora endophytica]GIG67048.1 hypothetical protein Pen01_33430 [Phytomonospora endophytica]